MPALCHAALFGRIDYPQAWALQERLSAEIASGQRPAALLLLEHPHTFTFGRRGRAENLLWDQAELARRGVSLFWVDRGGDITYHGPGQLVGYPLLPLAPGGLYATASLPKPDFVGYLRRLEEMLILALSSLGVKSRQIPGLTGVWVDGDSWKSPAKIASIGVKVDARGVSRHGFALNVAPDMSYWQGINACGLKDTAQACLADFLSPPPTLESACQQVISAFGRVFNFDMIQVDPVSLLSTQLAKTE